MKEINFMTIGDDRYFRFINLSAKQLMKFYPNCRFFIYDWGFTPFHKEILKSYPISVLIDWYDKLDWEFGYKEITDKFQIDLPPEELLVQRKKLEKIKKNILFRLNFKYLISLLSFK